MEDIRIGRKTQSVLTVHTVTNVSAELIPDSPKRIAVIISPPAHVAGANERITITDRPTAVDGQGIIIPENTQALSLTLANAGDFVTKALRAISAGAGPYTIGVLSTYYTPD